MAKTITFKKDTDLDWIDEILASVEIRNQMPDKVKGKRAPMVLWALEELAKNINGNSQEKQQLIEQNEQLKEEVRELTRRLERVHKMKDWWEKRYKEEKSKNIDM